MQYGRSETLRLFCKTPSKLLQYLSQRLYPQGKKNFNYINFAFLLNILQIDASY